MLPAEVAQDAERLARFEREAKLLASLNHPNVAHAYAFEGATLPDMSRPTRPEELFTLDTELRAGDYDVAPDGRFLMLREASGTTITIVLNWFEELKAMEREGGEEMIGQTCPTIGSPRPWASE